MGFYRFLKTALVCWILVGAYAPPAFARLTRAQIKASECLRKNFLYWLESPEQEGAAAENANIVENNLFNVVRGIEDYERELPSEFSQIVAQLGPDDIYLDSGAGTAKALIAIFQRQKALGRTKISKLIALVAKRPDKSEHYGREQENHNRAVDLLEAHLDSGDPDRVKYLEGQFIEARKTSEIAPPGSVRLITDFVGPASYSEHLDIVLRKYFTLLKPGGDLFLKYEPFRLGIVDPKTGKGMEMPEFVRRYCKGIVVHESPSGTCHFSRTSDLLFVPGLAKKSIMPGQPPFISFKFK